MLRQRASLLSLQILSLPRKKKLADDEQWPNLPQRRNREKSNFYGNDTTTQAKARIPNRINIFL